MTHCIYYTTLTRNESRISQQQNILTRLSVADLEGS